MKKLFLSTSALLLTSSLAIAGVAEGNVEVALTCGSIREFVFDAGELVATSVGENGLEAYETNFSKVRDQIFLFDIIRGDAADAVMIDPVKGFDAFDDEIRSCLETGTCDEIVISERANTFGLNLHDACRRDYQGQ